MKKKQATPARAPTKSALRTVRLDARVVPIAQLEANPWNVNALSQREFEAARESIRLSGFVDPVTVRAHPKKKDRWQILDGEHRWRAAKEESWTTISINVLDIPDDSAARKLTLQLNIHGEADRLRLAQELALLQQALGARTGEGLPWSESEIEELLALAKTAMPEYAEGGAGEPEHAGFTTFTFHVPEDAAKVVEEAVVRAMKEGESENRGVALERICADYLASAEVAS
jgi:ParB/RepB/Spo0J family partition protein